MSDPTWETPTCPCVHCCCPHIPSAIGWLYMASNLTHTRMQTAKTAEVVSRCWHRQTVIGVCDGFQLPWTTASKFSKGVNVLCHNSHRKVCNNNNNILHCPARKNRLCDCNNWLGFLLSFRFLSQTLWQNFVLKKKKKSFVKWKISFVKREHF